MAAITRTTRTSGGIAYDRAGPRGDLPVVLLHAGIADRRMWGLVWPALTAERDALRLDLRGFGESAERPPGGVLSPADDVLATLAELGIDRCHLVGASFGAGVAVEAALTAPPGPPERVASLLLAAPGGSLIPEATPDMRAFIEAEREALARDDLDAAVAANVRWWVGGAAPSVRELVGRMQRRAFEVTAAWDDVETRELDPPALDRLAEIRVPTLVLVGGRDLDAIHDTAGRVVAGIAGARRVDWPDVAHLPSMERPAGFLALLRQHVSAGA
jgi:pimeloyl-ACP methyl ester carboxylesterase